MRFCESFVAQCSQLQFCLTVCCGTGLGSGLGAAAWWVGYTLLPLPAGNGAVEVVGPIERHVSAAADRQSGCLALSATTQRICCRVRRRQVNELSCLSGWCLNGSPLMLQIGTLRHSHMLTHQIQTCESLSIPMLPKSQVASYLEALPQSLIFYRVTRLKSAYLLYTLLPQPIFIWASLVATIGSRRYWKVQATEYSIPHSQFMPLSCTVQKGRVRSTVLRVQHWALRGTYCSRIDTFSSQLITKKEARQTDTLLLPCFIKINADILRTSQFAYDMFSEIVPVSTIGVNIVQTSLSDSVPLSYPHSKRTIIK